jgi:hypothetical protein
MKDYAYGHNWWNLLHNIIITKIFIGIYKLAPWSRVLLGKPIILQLV